MDFLRRYIPKFFTFVIALGLPVIGYLNRWAIYDYWRLRGYEAPARITELAEQTTMLPGTEKIFYSNMPALNSKEEFRTNCTSAEATIVLGCYRAFDGIYLQDISDERLEGVMQVTAAHEVLHAHYQRMEWWEKERITKLLEAEFARIDNQRIKDTIDRYREQGADIVNELHSILGTEVRELSAELEAYYAQFFADRQKIVDFSERYEEAFESRKEQVARYDEQLKDLKARIDSNSAELSAKQADLQARQAELNRLLEQNKTEEYNARVPGFNQLVQAYNGQVSLVRSLIDEYNNIVKLRNEITLEQSELFEAIDSRPDSFN